MVPGSRKGSQKQGAIRCAYCQRPFARAEHLARHERSHRKEKPFKCNFCESTFARKDVIKRHNLRYHASLPEVRMATTAAQNTVSNMNALAAEERHQTTHSEHSPALVLPTTANGIYLEGGQDNFAALPYLSQPSLVPTDANSLLDSIGYTFTADDMLFGGTGAFDDGMNEMQSMALNALNSSPSSLSTEVNRKHWRGSWEISVAKRSELEREVQAALSRNGDLHAFTFSSCLKFERLFTSCFEGFLTYLPCIHVPTWRAESAHPYLLMAMASLGACYDKDHKTAQILYRAGRASITKYVEPECAWSTEQPDWLVQSILILITYGTSSGKLETFNEASSWTSFLANVLRRQRIPEFSLSMAEAEQDPLTAWQQWIDYEMAARTKCAAYCILNNISVCYNVAPSFLNDEMGDTYLPCCEGDWICTTPMAWLEARKHAQPYDARFREALNSLFSPQLQTIRTGIFGGYVALHGIVQRMWRLQPDNSMINCIPDHSQVFYTALQKWQITWEDDPECAVPDGNPHGAMSSNAAALLRLAHMRLHTDFSPVRSAMVTQDAEIIAQSMKGLCVRVDRSHSSLNAAAHALQSLRTRIKLGMASKAPTRVSPHGLQIHLVSIECCLFASAWMKNLSSHPESGWTSEEKECVRLVEEILAEVEIGQSNAGTSYSTQLIAAWASVFECCAVWGIQSVLADALKRYAEIELQ